MNKKGFSLIELLIVIVIIGIIVIIAVPSLLESKKAAQETAATAMLRNLASAEVAYSSKSTNQGFYGSLANLTTQGFIDNRFNGGTATIDGYTFTAAAMSYEFTITGTAQQPGNPDFYINHTMTVFYTNGSPVSR